jgi:hypothetical protein
MCDLHLRWLLYRNGATMQWDMSCWPDRSNRVILLSCFLGRWKSGLLCRMFHGLMKWSYVCYGQVKYMPLLLKLWCVTPSCLSGELKCHGTHLRLIWGVNKSIIHLQNNKYHILSKYHAPHTKHMSSFLKVKIYGAKINAIWFVAELQ